MTGIHEEKIEKISMALRKYLVDNDDAFQLAIYQGNYIVTLDGIFDMRDFARVALAAIDE